MQETIPNGDTERFSAESTLGALRLRAARSEAKAGRAGRIRRGFRALAVEQTGGFSVLFSAFAQSLQRQPTQP